jgi:Transcription-repair coupling factor (superfamily II helicase)
LNALIAPLWGLSGFKNLIEDIKTKNTPVLLTGVIDVQTAHLIAGVESFVNAPSLIVAEDELKAKEIYEDIRFFNKNAMYYPTRDFIFYSADVHSRETDMQRARVVNALVNDKRPTVVLSVEALFDRHIKKETFEKYIITISEGQVINVDKLIESLVFMGYERTELVEGAGQFTVRGGIIDVFSPVEETAVRIEMWDNEIDSVRTMDCYSQRSLEKN